MSKGTKIVGIALVVGAAAVALSACGTRCQTVSQQVAYLDDDGNVAYRTVERELCQTPVRSTASNNPVHAGSGDMTARMVMGQE